MALKTPNEAYQALRKALQEQLSEFKKTVEADMVYTPRETAHIVKESIKEKVLEFQDSLVKMRAVENGEVLEKKTPPDVSEELMHKLKRQYGGDKEKAYATAWSIHNKKHKKKEPELDIAYNRYKKKNKAKKAEDCPEHSMEKGWGPKDHEGDPNWTKPESSPAIPNDPPWAHQSLSPGNNPVKPAAKPKKPNLRVVKEEVGKAEPGQMTSPELLQVGHAKPTVPTAASDKHPKAHRALPIDRHPELPPTVGGGGTLPKGKQLEKNLYGLPGPAQTPPEMAHKLSKNVFQMLNRPVTKAVDAFMQVPEMPTAKNDVINTTFKAEDKEERSFVKKPVTNPNATTDIQGKDIKDIDRAQYERELYELHHKQAELPSDKLPEDANSKDTGSGGQIQKGKMNKDEFPAVKPRISPPLTPMPKLKPPGQATNFEAPVKTRTSPTLTGLPNFKSPAHAAAASSAQGGTNPTVSLRPGGMQKAGPKLSIPTLQHKNGMMPSRQQSAKIPSMPNLAQRQGLSTNLTPPAVKSEKVEKGGVNLWEKEKK